MSYEILRRKQKNSSNGTKTKAKKKSTKTRDDIAKEKQNLNKKKHMRKISHVDISEKEFDLASGIGPWNAMNEVDILNVKCIRMSSFK